MSNEAAELVALDVASPAEIDEAMRLGTAFPDGPLAMADKVGVDTVLSALRDHPRSKPAAILSEMVAHGDLGAKSGKGFYQHRMEGEMMTQGTLLIAKDPATHVATITINRADRLNTLTPEFFEDLDRALARQKFALAVEPELPVEPLQPVRTALPHGIVDGMKADDPAVPAGSNRDIDKKAARPWIQELNDLFG